MSAQTKLKGGPIESELTKLKRLWRDTLSEESREQWRWLFVSSGSTQAQVRADLKLKLGVNLQHDSQLNRFRDWEMDQRARDLQAERAAENERRIIEAHPDWTLDQVRAEVFKQAHFEALATGDFKLGLKAAQASLQAETVSLDARKVALLEKKAAAYDQLKQAAQTSGGITPETLTKIERELKLL